MARKTPETEKPKPRKAVQPHKEAPLPKQQKSVFRVNTLFTVLFLAALIGFAFYLNREKKNTEAEATPSSEISFMFSEADGQVDSIEIKPSIGDAQHVKVARDKNQAWALELPIKTEADQGAAEAAASQVSTLQVISSVEADPSDLGLDAPAFIITIKFTALAGGAGETHTLEIGDSTPTTSGYYVRLDKGKIMIVDLYGIDSLLQLAAFPPYLNTPTPSPLPPTETPVSPTGEVPTPDLSVTPTP